MPAAAARAAATNHNPPRERGLLGAASPLSALAGELWTGVLGASRVVARLAVSRRVNSRVLGASLATAGGVAAASPCGAEPVGPTPSNVCLRKELSAALSGTRSAAATATAGLAGSEGDSVMLGADGAKPSNVCLRSGLTVVEAAAPSAVAAVSAVEGVGTAVGGFDGA